MPSDAAIRAMIDDYITRVPEPNVVSSCSYCEGELYEGQEVTVYEDEVFCDEDCLVSYLRQHSYVYSAVLGVDY
ncbi:hypothetical protein [Alicyclobacillus macrosporangiidus]|jgi:hypothetical protein|uniref:Zinc-finger of the FCS-type, C2-C2 n=1 Tax=Alicyclobacillus macrosporangiidus TaxID=392015 RepID=A0A1I7FU12_9BACL|nr:hypothetical protein [Alicyclobacillus macrosporangiidus]SFU39496.1 zinc-finger of the FCS-type, C2-C2 [Alicyclobacillus macrosporangiidus]